MSLYWPSVFWSMWLCNSAIIWSTVWNTFSAWLFLSIIVSCTLVAMSRKCWKGEQNSRGSSEKRNNFDLYGKLNQSSFIFWRFLLIRSTILFEKSSTPLSRSVKRSMVRSVFPSSAILFLAAVLSTRGTLNIDLTQLGAFLILKNYKNIKSCL